MADRRANQSEEVKERQGDRPAALSAPSATTEAGTATERDEQFERLLATLRDSLTSTLASEIVVLRREVTSEFYQGPLPSPRVLQGFEDVVPGSAAMIMQNYDAQAKHRREMESFALKWENVRAICGIIAAFLITIVVVIVSYQSIINGNVIEGTLLAGINLALLIGAFIYGTRSRREERLERTKLMAETEHRSDAAE